MCRWGNVLSILVLIDSTSLFCFGIGIRVGRIHTPGRRVRRNQGLECSEEMSDSSSSECTAGVVLAIIVNMEKDRSAQFLHA
jgi:hypothetical protein